MANDDTVQVRMTATQTVRYDQIKTMKRKEWEQLKAMDEKDAASMVEGWLDLSDVSDADEIEGEDFEAFVVGDDGKAIKPADEYTGE